MSAPRDALLPNAAIVARHEYLDRVRSKLFLASTVILMVLAVALALAPIAFTYVSRTQPVTIGVVSSDEGLRAEAIGTIDRVLNPEATGDATVSSSRAYIVQPMPDRQ